jgi:hypothetical protein
LQELIKDFGDLEKSIQNAVLIVVVVLEKRDTLKEITAIDLKD